MHMIRIVHEDTAPGKLASAELHFPTLTDVERASLMSVATRTCPDIEGAHALQEAARLALLLEGLKLVGFAVWERRSGGGRNVTFPARAFSVNGERRSFALLRPGSPETLDSQARLRDAILEAYAETENSEAPPAAAQRLAL